jgi:hypothetical protein
MHKLDVGSRRSSACADSDVAPPDGSIRCVSILSMAAILTIRWGSGSIMFGLASAMGCGLCQDRDAAFGHATPVRFFAGEFFSTEEERAPRRAAETCADSDDKAARAGFRRWAKGPQRFRRVPWPGARMSV